MLLLYIKFLFCLFFGYRRVVGDGYGKCQVTNLGNARRRLWEIPSGGRRINEQVFR